MVNLKLAYIKSQLGAFRVSLPYIVIIQCCIVAILGSSNMYGDNIMKLPFFLKTDKKNYKCK